MSSKFSRSAENDSLQIKESAAQELESAGTKKDRERIAGFRVRRRAAAAVVPENHSRPRDVQRPSSSLTRD